MIVKLENAEYVIRWRHDQPSHRTLCNIEEIPLSKSDPTNRRVVGEARVHPNDSYCRDTGRKVSLANALHALGERADYKLVRKAIWTTYRHMKKQPRW